VFDSPNDAIHEQFELVWRDVQQCCWMNGQSSLSQGSKARTWETMQIDSTQKPEETGTMLGKFSEILIYHT
jgi:hypothetical protein